MPATTCHGRRHPAAIRLARRPTLRHGPIEHRFTDNHLRRTALRREDLVVSAWTFLKLGALVMLPALLLAIARDFLFRVIYLAES